MMFYTTTWGFLFSEYVGKVIFQNLGILIFQSQMESIHDILGLFMMRENGDMYQKSVTSILVIALKPFRKVSNR